MYFLRSSVKNVTKNTKNFYRYLWYMDKKTEILLGSQKNINSVNVDTYDRVELVNHVSELMDYDVNEAVSESDIFDAERETNNIYRIYGRIEYLSLLNNIKSNYTLFSDFLTPQFTGNTKNIFNSFDFYLVRPASSGYTQITGSSGSAITGGISIIDEKFDNWVTTTPTNYPFGWTPDVVSGSYIQQAPTNKAQFVLGNNIYFNLAALIKTIPSTYGNIVIETNISSVTPSLDPVNDLFQIFLGNATNAFLYNFRTLSTGIGYKKYLVTIPASSAITRVTLWATTTNKSIFVDYFKMYSTGSTNSSSTGATVLNPYVRYYEVIATPNDFELFNAGFSNNVYGEQTFAFNFKRDFDVSSYFDNFGFPATELFLYAKYKPTTNGNPSPIPEHLYYSDWGTTGSPVKTLLSTAALNIGDKVYGDIINYDLPEFTQTQISGQTYYITTTCQNSNLQNIILTWKYNPFIQFRLAYFGNELNSANTGTTSYDIQVSIPAYATPIDNAGNLVWRDIQPQGYTDPLTGIGVDYPFINMRRYLFSRIILSIIPDMTDGTTVGAFNIIWFTQNPTLLNVLPNSDLSNIGKPCQ